MRLEVKNSRSGLPVIVACGQHLASSVDPEHEAEKWLNGNLERIQQSESTFIMGMGSGYHVRRAAVVFPTKNFVVFEAQTEVARSVEDLFGIPPRNVEIIFNSVKDKLAQSKLFCQAIRETYCLTKYLPSYIVYPEFYRKIESLILGRDAESFQFLLRFRPGFQSLFTDVEIDKVNAISIKTIFDSLPKQSNDFVEEHKMIFALRELVR